MCSVHICPVGACAAHIYQFVLILGHRRRRARGVGAEGSRELPGHQLRGHYQLLPTEPIVIPSQTHHFVIPSASSDARANHSYIFPLGEILKKVPKMKIRAGFIFLTSHTIYTHFYVTTMDHLKKLAHKVVPQPVPVLSGLFLDILMLKSIE